MLVRLLSLLPTLLLLAGQLWAQAYEPGLLVRSTGDTLRGEIENGFWVEAPTFVRYRRTPDSPSQLLQARQLRAISFTNGRYFRYEALQLDQDAEARFENLIRGNVVNMRTDSVLAEVLLAGPVELLRVVRPGATHYEMRRPGQLPLSLSERKYLKENNNGAWVVIDGNNYRNQLGLYFIDCPAANSAAQVAPFTAQGLAEVAQAYATTCTPAQQPARSWLNQAAPRRRGAFLAGVLVGARYNRLESMAYPFAGTQTDGGVHPFGGLYAELMQPSRVTAVYGELSLSSFRSQGAQISGYDANGIAMYKPFDYQAMLGTARMGIRYFFPLPHDRQVVLGLGFEQNITLGLTLPASGGTYNAGVSPSTKAANDAYAITTLLPNFGLGWRAQRFTVMLDGQVYASKGDAGFIGNAFLGSSFAARLGLSYRLSRNTDVARPGR